jgi:hypothetical protein
VLALNAIRRPSGDQASQSLSMSPTDAPPGSGLRVSRRSPDPSAFITKMSGRGLVLMNAMRRPSGEAVGR